MKTQSRIKISTLALIVSFITCGFHSASAGVDSKETKNTETKSTAAKKTVPSAVQHQKMVASAIEYLRTKGQSKDGSFNGELGPGTTALITNALIQNGRTAKDPMVANAIKFILTHVQKDGGIYKKGSTFRNYDTCLSIMCLTKVNKNEKYSKTIKNAEKFIRKLQWDGDEGLDKSNTSYGGAGYGKHKRPDMSNTGYFIEALKASGASADDPAIQAALRFVSQSQNLESEHNTGKFATKNPDGGLIYSPHKDGETKGEPLPNGGLRSYGSMTYVGLKSFIYAGLKKDDKRVKAAVTWVKKNYDLKTNPGLGSAGLYYYFHLFAKALDVMGEDVFIDADGTKHDWRQELTTELASRQRKDGSFVNKENSRWLEGNPNLVTGYALLALSHCKPKSTKVAK